MKQYKYILQFVVALFLFAACSDESVVKPGDKVEEGLPATVTIAFKSADAPSLETRATDVSTAAVEGLAVLVFDKTTKDKVGKTQFFSDKTGLSGNITLNTTSGERLIYAVANYNSSNYGDLEQTLNNVIDLDGLKNLQIGLQNKQFTFLDGKILMSGFYGADGSCTIKEGNNTFAEKIQLKRIASTVLVNWKCTEGEFIPDSWEIKEIPNESALIERDEDYILHYFNTGEQTAFSKELTSADNSFSFIMFENRKFATAEDGITSVDMREYAEGRVENFKKAPAKSTYLVLKGTYKGKTKKDQNGNDTDSKKEVNATVQYYVHLGLVNGNNDFSVDRNSKYVYNLKINGVDDIIVEVTKNDHIYSADGQITLPDNPTVVLDAHYGVVKLKFNRELINGIKADVKDLDGFKANFQIKVSTPVNGYSYDATDLDWITFTRNTVKNTNDNLDTGFVPYHPDNAKSVSGFQEDLYTLKEDDFKNGYVYYTCYIDEYYYPEEELSTFINAKDRSVQINYKQTPASGASDSEIISSIYLIRQHSIQSIYDLDELAKQNVNGWGVEWSMEHGAMKYSSNNKGGKLSDVDGRSNMIGEVMNATLDNIKDQGPEWKTYVDFYTNSNQGGYRYAYAECMNRNRDLNGDGHIQSDEIRWYLPAINQYVGMWIGAPALNPEVCLYTLTASAETYHYVSNTKQGVEYPRIIWAEEGSSLGNLGHGSENGVGGKWMYRCVRNIGKQGVEDYKDYVKFKGSVEVGGSFDISLLNKTALRQAINKNQSLGTHSHVDEENEIAKNGFAVSGSKDGCKSREGWRLPNQRETTLIGTYVPEIVNSDDKTNNQFASCTQYEWNKTQTYWFQIEEGGLYGNVTKGSPIKSSYRCVYDE